ncbi:hypothetical protein BHE74_00002988 [Ensete ventricosum]|nr:hypothetical protein GW17_00005861 [Ensete ventricosum]RWW88145.1 hypothetical protein BHE74_00002988 [Ensete ventricosum]RZR98915.1 hypothetical protein BHM03_00028363 [Ensete ventricosum]
MTTNTPSFAYMPLHECRILRVSNSPHLCELCTTLLVVAQHISLCTISSFAKRLACHEHHQVWLPMSSRSSNSAIPTFVRYVFFSSLFVLVVPLAQRIGHSSKCQSWMLALPSDPFLYISMSVSSERSRVLAALHATHLGPSRLHDKCFYMCLSRFDTKYHKLVSPKPPMVP